MINKLNSALEFIRHGISVIPLHHRSKEPALKSWLPYTTLLSTSQEVYQWLASEWQNYGVIAGWKNLVILDFDNIEYFDLWVLWCNSMHIDIDPMFKVLTSRGIHVYLRTVAPSANDKRIGIDVQAHRRFVVGPGSTHPNGTVYQPIGEFKLVEVLNVETILPVELFPKVAQNVCQEFHGTPAEFHPTTTEYQYDAFQAAMWGDDADLITKVKRAIRIESLFATTIKTSADGRWLATLCPFHNDTRPSAWIDTRRQLFGCAVCNFKPLDVINLFARQHNISDAAAVSALAREVGIWA